MKGSAPHRIGIDLGTTFSLAAILRDGAPFVLPNALGELLTPSAVSLGEEGQLLVGAPARARATTHPERTALAFKRDMGTSRLHTLGGRTFRPEELSALVLGALKADAEAALGAPVDEAVVTVPAYFGDAQRKATRDAAAIAGLHVERIINEPTAAALAYGLHQRERDLRAVVLDLGGGTFDVTVVEIASGVVEIQASAGDARLGGGDFDAALAAHLGARLERELGVDARTDPRARARLLEAAELSKKRLSEATESRLPLVGLPTPRGLVDAELVLQREEAESVWAELLERIRVPIRRAMADAGLRPGGIDEVLLVGGSSRLPCFSRLAAQLFGRLPLRALPPDEAVALGAAVQAALKGGDESVSEMVVTDVAPFTLGIASVVGEGRDLVTGMFSPIIHRGTVIPVSRSGRYFTVHDGQSSLRVEVYQGEHSLCRDNERLGEYALTGLPRRAAGEVEVDVRFTYDMNGILDVDMSVVGTAQRHSLVITPSGSRLSKEQVEAARQAMKGLKLDPREALPNTTALARAEALYVELRGEAREQLGQAMGRFRVALQGQEPEAIDASRAELVALTARLRRLTSRS